MGNLMWISQQRQTTSERPFSVYILVMNSYDYCKQQDKVTACWILPLNMSVSLLKYSECKIYCP